MDQEMLKRGAVELTGVHDKIFTQASNRNQILPEFRIGVSPVWQMIILFQEVFEKYTKSCFWNYVVNLLFRSGSKLTRNSLPKDLLT